MTSSRVTLLVAALAWISLSVRAQETRQQSEDDRIAVTVDSIWRTNEYPSEYRPRTFRVPSLGEEADFVVIHFTIARVKNGHVKFPGPGGPGPRVVGNDENEYTPIQMWRRRDDPSSAEFFDGSAVVTILMMPKASEPAVLRWSYDWFESSGEEARHFQIDIDLGTTDKPGSN